MQQIDSIVRCSVNAYYHVFWLLVIILHPRRISSFRCEGVMWAESVLDKKHAHSYMYIVYIQHSTEINVRLLGGTVIACISYGGVPIVLCTCTLYMVYDTVCMYQFSPFVDVTNVTVWLAGLAHGITIHQAPVKPNNILVVKWSPLAFSGGQLMCGLLLEWLLQSPGKFFHVRIIVYLRGNFHGLHVSPDPFDIRWSMSGPEWSTVTLWHRTTALYSSPFHSSSLGIFTQRIER